MTNWLPDLSSGSGPLYIRLADRIETDISNGELPPGTKLPPQRDLAYDIGVTIGTVGRAYALVRERGLVSGEVGRGTFVRGERMPELAPAPVAPLPDRANSSVPPQPGRLRMDSTSAPDIGQSETIQAMIADISHRHPFEIIDYTRTWPQHWREAGSRWLGVNGWKPEPHCVVPALGVHAAVMSVISSVTQPGDKIVFEKLTYTSITRAVNLIGRRSIVVGSDEQGCDPDDFERLCAQQHPKLAFLMPTLHNPTLATMSDGRRQAIAAVARKYNVLLVEDAIYSVLKDEQPAPIAALAPERTFHVGGLSKAVSAGVRAGWVACPANYASRVQTAHKMMTGGMPFLLAELAAQLVLTGEAKATRAKVREEISAREQAARRIFAGHDFASDRDAPFLWMKLPDPWFSATFRTAALDEGVMVDDEDEYKPLRTDHTYHRVRIGFTSVRTRDDAVRGFGILRRLLDHGGAMYDSFG